MTALVAIKSVKFPMGNNYEGSPCIITFVDGKVEKTIGDRFYQLAEERNLTRDEMKALRIK